MEGKRKILVIDDMEENILLLQIILTEAGFQVITGHNGEEDGRQEKNISSR